MTSAPAPAYAHIDPTAIPAVIAAGLRRIRVNDRIDEALTEVIAAHEEGYFDEAIARDIIASTLLTTNIIPEAIGGARVEPRISDEVGDLTRAALVAKILDQESGHFDLTVVAGGTSACGWFRKHAKGHILQFIRDTRRAEKRTGTATDPTGFILDAVTYDPDPEEGPVAQNLRAERVDEFEAKRHGLRGRPRVRLAVEQAIELLGVPAAVRPEDHRDRDAVAKMLRKDARLARRSLETFAAVVCGSGETRLDCNVDDRLLSLWDSFDVEQIEILIEADPRFAAALAEYAVSPLARPSKKSIQKMRAAAARIVPGDLRWRTLSTALVESWVDTECEPVSDFSVSSEDEQTASKKGHVVSRSRWDNYVGQVANFPGYPLGATPGMVTENLMTMGIQHLISRDFNLMREERDKRVAAAAELADARAQVSQISAAPSNVVPMRRAG